MKTGLIHKLENTSVYDEWRMYISKGYIRVTFRKKNGRRTTLWSFPFDPFIKKNTGGESFSPEMNENEWKQFDEEFKILFERQKQKYPEAHKKQKSATIKDINFKKKHCPYDFTGVVNEWTEYLLKICRQRK